MNHWKENFDELESTTRNKAWTKVALAVSILGTNKTMKTCKNKIRNLRDMYRIAKYQNKTTGENFHSLPYFEAFDEKLGLRVVMVMLIPNQSKSKSCKMLVIEISRDLEKLASVQLRMISSFLSSVPKYYTFHEHVHCFIAAFIKNKIS